MSRADRGFSDVPGGAQEVAGKENYIDYTKKLHIYIENRQRINCFCGEKPLLYLWTSFEKVLCYGYT